MTSANVLVAGSGNVTGMNVLKALTGNVDNLVGYDCCPTNQNPANLLCLNQTVPKASEPGYIEAVLSLVDQHRSKMIIASNDHEVRALATHKHEFESRGVSVNAMTPMTLSFLDKLETSQLFDAMSIPTPDVIDPSREYLTPPYVVRKRLVGTGKKFSFIVKHDGKAQTFFGDTSVVTRFVEGDEYTIDILADHGNPIAVVPRLRREVRNGMVHFGEIVKDEEVIRSSERICKSLGFDGMYCIQCIKNVDGCFFFEVNPRPGSGLDLSVAAGINMPALWVDIQLGLNVPRQEPVWGMKMVRYYSGYYFQ